MKKLSLCLFAMANIASAMISDKVAVLVYTKDGKIVSKYDETIKKNILPIGDITDAHKKSVEDVKPLSPAIPAAADVLADFFNIKDETQRNQFIYTMIAKLKEIETIKQGWFYKNEYTLLTIPFDQLPYTSRAGSRIDRTLFYENMVQPAVLDFLTPQELLDKPALLTDAAQEILKLDLVKNFIREIGKDYKPLIGSLNSLTKTMISFETQLTHYKP